MSSATDASNEAHESSTEAQEQYAFTGVLSEQGVDELDLVHRHISGLIDEYRLHITEDGWSFKSVDPANAAMVDVNIPTTLFETYECRKEIEVGVSSEHFNDVLQNSDGSLTYARNFDDERIFVIGDTEVEMIDPDSIRMEPDLPELDLPTEITVEDIELFTHFCENTGNHVQMSGSSEGLALHCDKDVSSDTLLLPDGDGSNVQRSTSNGETVDHERVRDFHNVYDRHSETDVSLFSQDYLELAFGNLLVRHKRGVSYNLQMGSTFPVIMERQSDSEDVAITFLLAPRVRN